MNRQNRGFRLKPAGWLALAVLALLVISGAALVGRALWVRARGLETLMPYSEYTPPPRTPTITPRPTITPTPAPPTATPTPEGWTIKTDFAGQEYLAPPPEVEQAVREAFEAVVMRSRFQGTPEEMASQFDPEAAQKRFARFSALGPEDTTSLVIAVPPDHWGPENPVRCEDFDTCTLGRAKIGPATGMLVFDDAMCQQALGQGHSAPCLLTGANFGGDLAPYQLFIATVELQEDGVWRVTNLQIEELPEPPSSS